MPALNAREVIDYYAREDVLQEMVRFSENREVAGRTLRGRYGQRPNAVIYPSDIKRMLKENMISFHGSVERWSNPMAIETGMKSSELDDLRLGWDFLIDIDSNFFDHSRICADLIVQALQAHGISSVFAKFSGRAGFHIMVPWEAFPKTVDGKDASKLFPDMPRTIAKYLEYFIKEEFAKRLLEHEGSAIKFAKKVKKPLKDVVEGRGLNPYSALKLDTLLISPRHLFRLPYSLHEKSWRASVPVALDKIASFELEMADISQIKKVVPYYPFKARDGEAAELVSLAYGWVKKKEAAEPKSQVRYKLIGSLPEEMFSPTIKELLSGLEDGRKRALFVLIAFMRRCGWGWDEIEEKIEDWNVKKNHEPLSRTYVQGQLRWHKRQPKPIMPPNFSSEQFYKNILGHEPVEAKDAKNPVVWSLRRLKTIKRAGKNSSSWKKGKRKQQ